MDTPALPAVVAGRSALPAFLSVEAWARERVAEVRAATALRLEEAVARAQGIARDGEAALREAALSGERDALREVEDRARDRISAERAAVRRWIDEAEAAAADLVDEAVARLSGR